MQSAERESTPDRTTEPAAQTSPAKLRKMKLNGFEVSFRGVYDEHALSKYYTAQAVRMDRPPTVITTSQKFSLQPPSPKPQYPDSISFRFTKQAKELYDSCTAWDKDDAESVAKSYSRNMAKLASMKDQHEDDMKDNMAYLEEQKQRVQELKEVADDARCSAKQAIADLHAAVIHTREACAAEAASAEMAFTAEEQFHDVSDVMLYKRKAKNDSREQRQQKKARELQHDNTTALDIVKAGMVVEMPTNIQYW